MANELKDNEKANRRNEIHFPSLEFAKSDQVNNKLEVHGNYNLLFRCYFILGRTYLSCTLLLNKKSLPSKSREREKERIINNYSIFSRK